MSGKLLQSGSVCQDCSHSRAFHSSFADESLQTRLKLKPSESTLEVGTGDS